MVHVSDIFVSRIAKIWQIMETYSSRIFSVTAATVAPAVVICLNSLIMILVPFHCVRHYHVFTHAQDFDFWAGCRVFKDVRINIELTQIRLNRPQWTLTLPRTSHDQRLQWYTARVKCQFLCNRDLSVFSSNPVWRSFAVEGRRLFSSSLQKIGKGLKSNGTRNNKEIDSRDLEKTGSIALVWVSLYTF